MKLTSKTRAEEKTVFQSLVEKLFKLKMEKDFNCGNGDGTYSHSFRCNCGRLDKEMAETQDEISKTKPNTKLANNS